MQREPRGLKGREKLKAIIDAARRIVLSDGLAEAKMSDIAAEAKVSSATVYAYFPSKDELFRAVVEAVTADVDVRLPLHVRGLEDDPIRRLAVVFLERLGDRDVRALFRIIAVEGVRFPEVRDLFDQYTRLRAHRSAVELFESLAAEGQVRPGVAEIASRQMLGMLEHETLVLEIMQGEAHRMRAVDDIARDAARTLWASFGLPLARSA